MKNAFKITNKVTAATVYVAAFSAEAALDEMAKTVGAASFADLKDPVFDTSLPRSLFEVTRGYWKAANLRGRFATSEALAAACAAKGIEPRWAQFWSTGRV